MKVALVGGKTGGHIIPLLRLSKYIPRHHEITYHGFNGCLEERILEDYAIPFHGISVSKSNVIRCFFNLLKTFKPDVVISTGGYVSFLYLLVARVKRIPVYLLEENAYMGLTNRCFRRYAKKVFLTFPLAKMRKNYLITFNPSACFDYNQVLFKKTHTFRIVVLGGSLGSKVLIDIAKSLKKELNEKEEICLVCGNYYEEAQKLTDSNFKVFAYLPNVVDLMASADMIISRAGSSTIAEVLALNKKLILVPSLRVKNNHQYLNANYLANKNACYLIDERSYSISHILQLIRTSNPQMLTSQRGINNRKVVSDILRNVEGIYAKL